MAIKVERDERYPYIIHQRFEGAWTWNDFHKSVSQVRDIFYSHIEQSFYVISNFSIQQTLPEGNPILHARKSLTGIPHNFALLIIVTNSSMIRILTTTFAPISQQMFGLELRTVYSMDAAMEIVKTINTSVVE